MEISLDLVQAQLGKKKQHLVTDETVSELNKLIADPDYGEEFLDSYMSYFNIMEKNSKWSMDNYMNAMKFFTLLEVGDSQVNAYAKVFPNRLQARLDRDQSIDDMRGEASRYNASALVNEIRKVSVIPIQLIHRNLLHEAILKQAALMTNPKVSHAVQQKASETLIRELKPTEDSTVNIKIGLDDEAKTQNRQLVDYIGTIALNQQKMLASGMSIEEIQKLNVNIAHPDEVIDVEEEKDD